MLFQETDMSGRIFAAKMIGGLFPNQKLVPGPIFSRDDPALIQQASKCAHR
jgi:hypothetical protein